MLDLSVSGVVFLAGVVLVALSITRRRKVRCDEKRPDCGHCSRLRLDCSWDDSGLRLGVRTKKVRQRLQQRPQQQQQLQTELPAQPELATENAEATVPSTSDGTLQAPDALSDDDDPSFNRMFSYASFMWDDSSPTGLSPGWDTLELTSSQDLMPWSDTSLPIPTSVPITYSDPMANTEALLDRERKFTTITSPTIAIGWSETQLADYFARSAAPPILATVETSARWFWMRKQLTSMTSTSRMVKFGVIAFVALELESAGTLEPATYTKYYCTAKERLEECLKDIGRDRNILSSQLRHILAVLFLLSYIDLLTKDVSKAHANLREGFHALEMVDIDSISVTGMAPKFDICGIADISNPVQKDDYSRGYGFSMQGLSVQVVRACS